MEGEGGLAERERGLAEGERGLAEGEGGSGRRVVTFQSADRCTHECYWFSSH